MSEKLRIIPLGGLNEIGKNITVLEYGRDMIVVDCGLGFPEDDMYGVDLVIPDVTYLVNHQQKLHGFFITHGHEDHIGSLPYVLQAVNAPVHGTPLTNGLIRLKLEEHGLTDSVTLVTHQAGDIVQAGCFQVEFIHVNHSIADAVAFCIHTPVGRIVMTGDFKIDPTSPEGMTDLARLGELGKEGVLAMLCDSTNAERGGYTPSESVVTESIDRQFRGCDKRIIITTFASNMYRIQSILNIAKRHGRKVAVTGRSMENILKVASELGYLQIPQDLVVDISEVKNIAPNRMVIVATGSQGENMSALARMAFDNHRRVTITALDRVLISASAIPGNEKAIGKIINELYRKGAEVVYDKSEGLHVSGHACQEELKLIHALLKPRFFIPAHGEQRMLRTHEKLALQMGMSPKRIFVADIGQVFELTAKTCKLTGELIPAGKIFVDGFGVGDVGSMVLRDRKHLAQDGVIVVNVNLSAEDGSVRTGPDIVTRGFVYVKDAEDLMDALRYIVCDSLDRCRIKRIRDHSAIKMIIKNDLTAYLYKAVKRNPMIVTILTEL